MKKLSSILSVDVKSLHMSVQGSGLCSDAYCKIIPHAIFPTPSESEAGSPME